MRLGFVANLLMVTSFILLGLALYALFQTGAEVGGGAASFSDCGCCRWVTSPALHGYPGPGCGVTVRPAGNGSWTPNHAKGGPGTWSGVHDFALPVTASYTIHPVDWQEWHTAYDDPDSNLARRLQVVQDRIRTALDEAPSGPITVISLCAGQGRDLLEVLTDHPRRADVRARLVELDGANADVARSTAGRLGLTGVETVVGDAALTDHYAGMVPADLVLMCGVFGNITDEDVARTIGYGPRLCRRDATLIWTRHREPPDLVPRICDWFSARGFERVWLSEPGVGYGVGMHRFQDDPLPLDPGERMFTFIGRSLLRG